MDGGGSRKRSRGAGTVDAAVRRAIAINSRERSTYPRRDYGYAHFKRGSELSRGMFGPSFKDANEAQRASRKQLGFVGKGGYFMQKLFKAKPGSWLDRAGDAVADVASFVPGVGAYVKPALALGADIHRSLTGAGQYTTATNDLINSGSAAAPSVPRFAGQRDGGVITISHREYISDVYAPALENGAPDAFGVSTFQINPGLEKTFPWLSQLAANYEEYTLKQCIFTFRSTVSDFAAVSGQVGQIVMATQYNAASDPFTDKRTMMEYDAAMSCKTSETLLHGVECDPAKLSGPKGRFVRSNPVEVSQDINQYDHAQFNIAVADAPAVYAGQSMGELWVSYTIELRKPRFFTAKGLAISRDVFVQKTISTTVNCPLGFSTSLAALGVGQQNSIGCTLRLPLNTNDTSLAVDGALFSEIYNPVQAGVPTAGAIMPTSTIVGVRIRFPDHYSGAVRILLNSRMQTAQAGANTGFYVYKKGQVRPIRDMLTQADSYNATPGYHVCALTGGASGLIQWLDVELGVASGGVSNEICFAYDLTGVPAFIMANALLDIMEYNTSMNAKQDGTNDSIVALNNVGSPV